MSSLLSRWPIEAGLLRRASGGIASRLACWPVGPELYPRDDYLAVAPSGSALREPNLNGNLAKRRGEAPQNSGKPLRGPWPVPVLTVTRFNNLVEFGEQ